MQESKRIIALVKSVGKTIHPEDIALMGDSRRIYTKEELLKVLPKMKDKPIGIDHKENMIIPNAKIENIGWNDKLQSILAELSLPEEYIKLIQEGKIKYCSWDIIPNKYEKTNEGIVYQDFDFNRLDLLTEGRLGGDPLASVTLLEENGKPTFTIELNKNKECRICGTILTEENTKKYNLGNICYECRKKEVNEWYRKKRKELRESIIQSLGVKCVWCGESNPIFLQIDHINGGGTKHRNNNKRDDIWYYKEIKESIDKNEGKYQLLCANCNFAKKQGFTKESISLKEPFAGYVDFDDCVAKNSDKEDPKAYCAVIMRATEESLRESANNTTDNNTTTNKTIEEANVILEKVKKYDELEKQFKDTQEALNKSSKVIEDTKKDIDNKIKEAKETGKKEVIEKIKNILPANAVVRQHGTSSFVRLIQEVRKAIKEVEE